MEEVLHYLALKNHYYEKFYTLTVKFIELANNDKWDDLELFVDNRERILNIIHSFDFKISTQFQKLNLSPQELEIYRSRVRGLMELRSQLASKIVAADLELISKMDEVKTETIHELKRTVETGQQLNSFTAMKRQVKPRKDA
jgi:hypothetical protein